MVDGFDRGASATYSSTCPDPCKGWIDTPRRSFSAECGSEPCGDFVQGGCPTERAISRVLASSKESPHTRMVLTRSMVKLLAEKTQRDQASSQIPCWFFKAGHGYCRHAEKCYYSHAFAEELQAPESENCMICYEVPTSYGLLEQCSHVFCLSCITRWRQHDVYELDDENTENQRLCPVCRAKSRIILPSNIFPSATHKDKLLEDHNLRCASQPCKYFQHFLPGKTFPGDPLMFYCPYFNDCLFEHKYLGIPFVYPDSMIVKQKSWLEEQWDDLFEYTSETDSDFSETSDDEVEDYCDNDVQGDALMIIDSDSDVVGQVADGSYQESTLSR